MYTMDVPNETMEEILTRYEPYLQTCRRKIVTGVTVNPATAGLAGYFERGKMLRALLVFIAASATGSEPEGMVPAAAALELLHGASLIHDDIVDEAATRRGLPTLHTRLGLSPALVMGDYLILLSFAVLKEADTIYDPYRVIGALHTLNYYARTCCLGEIRELLSSSHSDSEENYLAIVNGKTAAPFAAAATVPGILGRASLAEIEALRRYGLNLGVAYQIHDDVLDLIGDERMLGKPVGLSFTKGRPMLPLIYLERDGSPTARREFHRLHQLEDGRAELVRLLKAEGIWERVEATRYTYVSAALQALDRLQPSKEVEALKALVFYATTHQPVHSADAIALRH